MADIDDIVPTTANEEPRYDENDIKTLNWREHIRKRPGMYIGSVGDGSSPDNGIYVLLKEVIDNSIDEYAMGHGKQITIDITAEGTVTVRDYGRGIPLGSLVRAVSTMNTSGKIDSKAFQKSVGLNGVGVKAVNALSTSFEIASTREGQTKRAAFHNGELVSESDIETSDQPNGTWVRFTPDASIFRNYAYREDYVVTMMKNYSFLNTGLAMIYNGRRFLSRHGLLDLLTENLDKDPLYPVIHLKGEDIEIALTHVKQYGEEFYSFVNGQHTTQGGTHLAAFKKYVAQTIKDYFGKNFEPQDVRSGMVAAVAVRVQEPVFESQTKVKLSSTEVEIGGVSVDKFVGDFVKTELDNYMRRNLDVADIILKKVQESEKARKAIAGLAKQTRANEKKVSLHNKKLLDCTVHLNDPKGGEDMREASSIFITEGDSAAGSITKIRDVRTQAVFSLRGKPLNSYGLGEKELVLNEEFSLLRAALNLKDGIEGLRYNKVIIATDADVDGMHIRMLLTTFFLQFFPDLIKMGHVYVLQTPLFRVRSKKAQSKRKKAQEEVYYCYNDAERVAAIERFGEKDAEITRFKGLGEISPSEFREFIGPDMRLDQVTLRKEDHVMALLEFYMGKNTMERQNFIIGNLIVDDDSQVS